MLPEAQTLGTQQVAFLHTAAFILFSLPSLPSSLVSLLLNCALQILPSPTPRLLSPNSPSSQATLTWWPSAEQGTVQSPRLPGRWRQKVYTHYFGAEKKLSRAGFSSYLPGSLTLVPGLDTLLYFALIALKQMTMSPCGFDQVGDLIIDPGTV